MSVVKLDKPVAESMAVSDDNIEEILNVCELKIAKLIESVGSAYEEGDTASAVPAGPSQAAEVRIKLPDPLQRQDDPPDQENAGTLFSREAVKKASQSVIDKALPKK